MVFPVFFLFNASRISGKKNSLCFFSATAPTRVSILASPLQSDQLCTDTLFIYLCTDTLFIYLFAFSLSGESFGFLNLICRR